MSAKIPDYRGLRLTLKERTALSCLRATTLILSYEGLAGLMALASDRETPITKTNLKATLTRLNGRLRAEGVSDVAVLNVYGEGWYLTPAAKLILQGLEV